MDTEIRAPTHLLHCFFYKKPKKIEKSYESDEFITFMKELIFELTNCVMRVMNSSLLYYFFNLALYLSKDVVLRFNHHDLVTDQVPGDS